mmetsp:Transcript_5212/g.15227  ORF Transcript_5212/g.15227 Transcript_5212/m.15227 type:complete len:301 (-) Transcript_5212:941-1843(-)
MVLVVAVLLLGDSSMSSIRPKRPCSPRAVLLFWHERAHSMGDALLFEQPVQPLVKPPWLDIAALVDWHKRLGDAVIRSDVILNLHVRTEMGAVPDSDFFWHCQQDCAEQHVQGWVVVAQVEGAESNGQRFGQDRQRLVDVHAEEIESRAVNDVPHHDHASGLRLHVVLQNLHEEVEEHAEMILRVLVFAELDAIPNNDAAGLVLTMREKLLAASIHCLSVVVRHIEQGDVLRDVLGPKEVHLEIEKCDDALGGLADVKFLGAQEHQPKLRILHAPRRYEQRKVKPFLRPHFGQLRAHGLQ